MALASGKGSGRDFCAYRSARTLAVWPAGGSSALELIGNVTFAPAPVCVLHAAGVDFTPLFFAPRAVAADKLCRFLTLVGKTVIEVPTSDVATNTSAGEW